MGVNSKAGCVWNQNYWTVPLNCPSHVQDGKTGVVLVNEGILIPAGPGRAWVARRQLPGPTRGCAKGILEYSPVVTPGQCLSELCLGPLVTVSGRICHWDPWLCSVGHSVSFLEVPREMTVL